MKRKIIKGGLFDGIGGFDLPADWMGWETAFHCEVDPFCSRTLKYYWPNAINHGDITTTDFTIWRNRIDVLTGGFPCQPFSTAGLQNGTNDYRYLWPEMHRAIKEIRPTWVLGENVTGIFNMEDKSHVSKDVFFRVDSRNVTRLQEVDSYKAVYTRQAKMLLNNIIEDLEKIGYTVQTFGIPASATQAPHQRERVWIVAYADGTVSKNRQRKDIGASRKIRRHKKGDVLGEHSSPRIAPDPGIIGSQGRWAKGKREKKNEAIRTDIYCEPKGFGKERIVADPEEIRLQRSVQTNRGKSPESANEQLDGLYREWIGPWEKWPTQSPVCGGNDGIPPRMDHITLSKWRRESIKAFGNAVVPQVVLEFYSAIQIEMDKMEAGFYK